MPPTVDSWIMRLGSLNDGDQSRERTTEFVRHDTVNNIEELERALPRRLREAAERMPLNPSNPAYVRGVGSERHRGPKGLLAVCAAAVLLVVGVAIVPARDSEPIGVEASGSTDETALAYAAAAFSSSPWIGVEASGSTDGTAPLASNAPPATDTSGEPDAVLVTFVYPNAADPEMAGEWAVLNTARRTYYANGPASRLHQDSISDPNRFREAFETLEKTRSQPPADVIEALVEASAGAPLSTLGDEDGTWDDSDRSSFKFTVLTCLLASGMADSDQTADIRRLLESLPDVTVTPEGEATIVAAYGADGVSFAYDPTTGRPLRSTASTDAATDIVYLSVSKVRASSYLRPAPNETSSGNSTTTTTEGS